MGKILRAIGHFVKHAAIVVSAAFVTVFGSDIAHSFAVGALSLLNSELGKIAMKFVEDAATAQGLSGADKKAKAFANIAAEVKARGIEATNSMINLVIEAAVQRLQGSFGPAPTE